ALIALGMYVPMAWGGSLSLAYGAYASMGGYSVAILSARLDLPVLLGWVVGAVVSVVFAVILGLATARLSGFFLAAATLMFCTAFESFLAKEPSLGQSNGINGIAKLSIF